MKLLRAKAMGMCFGVRDAIGLAHDRAASGPVTVLGDLVHNEDEHRAARDVDRVVVPKQQDARRDRDRKKHRRRRAERAALI